MSMFLVAAVGVVTGVLGNVTTYLFINMWLPFFRKYVYQGFRIGGDWIIEQALTVVDGDALSERWEIAVNLDQKAYIITGNAFASNLRDNEFHNVIHYEVSGHIYDRFVALTFLNKDRKQIAHSTFLVEVVGDGHSMTGYRTFYGRKRNMILACSCIWRRKESLLGDCRSHPDVSLQLPPGVTE